MFAAEGYPSSNGRALDNGVILGTTVNSQDVRNGGNIAVKSKKQNGPIAKSSTEAELYGLHYLGNYMCWICSIMEEQGFDQGTNKLMQDNLSTITMAEKGKGTFTNSKHIDVRYFWLKDKADKKVFELVHSPTDDMIADGLKKVLRGKKFIEARRQLPVLNH